MQGYVLVFRPGLGTGAIVTEEGRALPFSTPQGEADLHGGDIVEFDLDASLSARAGGPIACVSDIEVVQSGADRLRCTPGPLAGELFETVQMDRLAQ